MAYNITFVLPGPSKQPVGGYKVVYEYANRLASGGHRVRVIHPAITNSKISWIMRAKRFLVYIYRFLNKSALPKWFSFHPDVEIEWKLDISDSSIPDADFVFATAWQTAGAITKLNRSKGIKMYFIQGLETWSGESTDAERTWHYELNKITISRWLQGVVIGVGESAVCIPNGLDHDTFNISVPISDRNPYNILMLYHQEKHKGSADGIAALTELKNMHPQLNVTLFSASPRPSHIPKWIDYHERPDSVSLKALYNSAAIFIAPSHTEGWGLTGCEALQCGAALIASAIPGHQEYAIHEETALLFERGSVADLIEKVNRLISDGKLRERLAQRGHEYVKRFTWAKSVAQLESVMNEHMSYNFRRSGS